MTTAEKLELPRCADCGRLHYYPRPACPFCGSARLEPVAASGSGTVYSLTTVERPPKAFAQEGRYTLALVALAEGPHLLTRLIGEPPGAWGIGDAVEVFFAPLGDGPPLPLFRRPAR